MSSDRASSFQPPTERAWVRLRNIARRLFPVSFPMVISRSPRKPHWAEPSYDAGIYVEHTDDNQIERVHIWLHARHSRSALIDCLWHELAHALCLDDDPVAGLKLRHDDAFWLKHGQIYRAWMRAKYGPDDEQEA